jgi:hypothetical protein
MRHWTYLNTMRWRLTHITQEGIFTSEVAPDPWAYLEFEATWWYTSHDGKRHEVKTDGPFRSLEQAKQFCEQALTRIQHQTATPPTIQAA